MAKRKTVASSDIYTAILALALLSVVSSAVFVAVKCGQYYGWSSLIQVIETSSW
jgi:hypothetical protein